MTDERRRRRELVDALLAELEERRRRFYRLRAGGVQPAGLREVWDEVEAVQQRLLEAL
jgi:hypothetical protein